MSAAIVFGGTFDPVHCGHVRIAAQVRDRLDAEVWFVPSGIPHLHAQPGAPGTERLALLEAALRDEPRCSPCDVEVTRGGVSYTVDTMHVLHARQPATELLVLLGADAARSIGGWHRSADLLAQERFVVVNRAGSAPVSERELESLGYHPGRVTLLDVDSPDISATEVRRRVAAGESIEGLVPQAVADLIASRGLYRGQPVHTTSG